MAQYTATHACGHRSETVKLFGKEDGRQRILQAMSREDCPECRAKAAHIDGWPDLKDLPPLENRNAKGK